ncbi:hypothetical protein Vafri_15336 [Volvox africanus]|uniref:CNNM transmembrane domain-containing protein n=1 Tax=Volvox africanus TaxID=51714 RepID=A0A8J4BGP0_9CHLO|nr:hypothetical protein Vafri_15336 [Volvox africanus]
MSILGRALLGDSDDSDDTSGSAQEDKFLFTLYICISLFLVLMAGLMSGLTLGLMSLDTVELEVLKRSGTPEERACAIKIMPVIKHQHFLLVTLLLCNAAATEALPLFIDRLADPVTAVILSVSVVLIFGEIIPQAVCSRYGLKVGAYSAWFVRILMTICSPIAWPIGKLLDFMLGPDHSALFRRAQLKALVDLHGSGAGFGGTLSEDEVHVIRGALDLTNKVACKSMTPLNKVFMLSTEDRLDERTLQAILMSGHSRIPVHREGNRKAIIGLILVKELVLINPAENTSVSSLRLRELPRLAAETPMYDMLKLFETGKSHMAVLTRAPGAPPLSPGHADGDIASGASVLGGRKPMGASWQTHPRGAPARRLGSAVLQNSRDGYAALADEYGIPGVAGLGEAEPVGIITIEDVIEELLQEEIIDETDLYIDNLQSQRVNAAAVAGSLPPRLRQVLSTGLFTPRVGRLGGGSPRTVLLDPIGINSVTSGAGSTTVSAAGGSSVTAAALAGGPLAAAPAILNGGADSGVVASASAASTSEPAEVVGEGPFGFGSAVAVAHAGSLELRQVARDGPHSGAAGIGSASGSRSGGSVGLEARSSSGRLSILRGVGSGALSGGSRAADADAKMPLLLDANTARSDAAEH